MASISSLPDANGLDLEACAREPIRIPGSIQPYGALFVVDLEGLIIRQAAVAPCVAHLFPHECQGKSLLECVPTAGGHLPELSKRLPDVGVVQLGSVHALETRLHISAYRFSDFAVVELELASALEPQSFEDLYPQVRQMLGTVQSARNVPEIADVVAREVRELTGFDRVLIYRFDEDWNGTVIAEDRNDILPSYLDLRFPAGDIPAQARELYRLNRLRLISDVNYTPVEIAPARNPKTGEPVDLSYAALRSVSPVHLEYMRNMGTAASMSISLVEEGRLWGLISCHSKQPKQVSYHVRTACDFIGQIASMQIGSRNLSGLAAERNAARSVQTRLLAHMSGAGHFVDGLLLDQDDLLRLTKAHGAAIVADGRCTMIGQCPEEVSIARIVEWLASIPHDDVWKTDNLATLMPHAEALKDTASGMLAISISQIHKSFLLWFRPEVIRTVTWGGEPSKPPQLEGQHQLHPRKSFEKWQETVRSHSEPWRAAEVEAATELRAAIVDIVLRKAEEMAALSERLVAINKELEAFSYSVSHDLRAPFRHIVGYAQLLKKFEGGKLSERGNRYIDTIVESAISAGTLVDDLLTFSQMGRSSLRPISVDMNVLFAEARKTQALDIKDRNIEWKIDNLPRAYADPMMMRLVVQNLLENAVKFTRGRDPAVITIAAETCDDGMIVFHVNDNGVGFDMAYVGKLFGVFQRLHRVEDFEGTGIGLANVKRIIERHGGRVWAEGELGKGATLSFSIPAEGRSKWLS